MATARLLAIVAALCLLVGGESDAVELGKGTGSAGIGVGEKPRVQKPGRCKGKGKRRRSCLRHGGTVAIGEPEDPTAEVQCDPPDAGAVTRCLASDAHVDESATWLFNTTLVRGCGHFYMHRRSGNAELGPRERSCADDLPIRGGVSVRCPVEPDRPRPEDLFERDPDFGGSFDHIDEPGRHVERPDLSSREPARTPAWVLALRGCGLGAVERVTVSGDGVEATLLGEDEIAGWPVPLSPDTGDDGLGFRPVIDPRLELRGTGPETRFVRFQAADGAEPVDRRRITIHYRDGGTQELEALRVVVARNGRVDGLEPAAAKWEDRGAFTLRGEHLGNAALVSRPCLASPEVVLNPEDRLIVRATLRCPREVVDPWEEDHVSIVNDPSCRCGIAAYDDLLSIYTELSKAPFTYGGPIEVGPNLEYLAESPALLGDSLAQGFYGGAVKPESQLWAYPQVVAFLMGAGHMEQNLILTGPGVEDAVKSFLPLQFGLAPDATAGFPQGENVGLAVGSDASTTRPQHTGIAGLDYTNILRTTGRCLDVEATEERPDQLQPPPNPDDDELRYDRRIAKTCEGVDCCQPDPLCRSERPWLEVQLGLGCSDETPMEIIEANRPTFVFASAAQNHFLGCATHTRVGGCVELDRFYRDSKEVFRRLRRIDSIRGGIVFGIPPLSRIPFLVEHPGGGRRVFWKRDGEVDTEGEVLDAAEVARLTALIDEANAHLAHLASLNGYAFGDSTTVFDRLADDGVPIVDQATGDEICRARPVIPTKTVHRDPFPGADAGCGMFGLDAVHPGKLGHGIMANEIVKVLNAFYGVDIPTLGAADFFSLWQADTLNQDPVDIRTFLTGDPPTACLAALAELSITLSTAPACGLTLGALCPFTLAAAIAAAGDTVECYESVIREAVRDVFSQIDREPEPKHCWGGPDEGVCHFLQ